MDNSKPMVIPKMDDDLRMIYEPRITWMFNTFRDNGYLPHEGDVALFRQRYATQMAAMRRIYGDQVHQARWSAEYLVYREYIHGATIDDFGCTRPEPMTPAQIEQYRNTVQRQGLVGASASTSAMAAEPQAPAVGSRPAGASSARRAEPVPAIGALASTSAKASERLAPAMRPQPAGTSASASTRRAEPASMRQRPVGASASTGAKASEQQALAIRQRPAAAASASKTAGHAPQSYSQALQKPKPQTQEWTTVVGKKPTGEPNPFRGANLLENGMPQYSAVTNAKNAKAAFTGREGRNLTAAQKIFGVWLGSHRLEDGRVCVWAKPSGHTTKDTSSNLVTVRVALVEWAKTRRKDQKDQAEEWDFFFADWMARRNKEEPGKWSVKVDRPYPKPYKHVYKHVSHPVLYYTGPLVEGAPKKLPKKEPAVDDVQQGREAESQLLKLQKLALKKLDSEIQRRMDADRGAPNAGEAGSKKWAQEVEDEFEDKAIYQERLVGIVPLMDEVIETLDPDSEKPQVSKVFARASLKRRLKLRSAGFDDDMIDALVDSRDINLSDQRACEALRDRWEASVEVKTTQSKDGPSKEEKGKGRAA